ncbi:MAG: hypothetical protein KAI72_07315 [Candidatus Pacebacteria bacterium]|nr:hypothetical protein [Candidatus Paceibacterota bacterium]
MAKRIILITVFVSALLFLNFFGKSYLRRRNALQVMQTVLTYWENGDIPQAMSFWENENNSPPVYEILTYEIGKKTFGKEDGVYTAFIAVTIYFPTNNQFPTGKEWIFELNKTRYGWKIMDFRLSTNPTSQ